MAMIITATNISGKDTFETPMANYEEFKAIVTAWTTGNTVADVKNEVASSTYRGQVESRYDDGTKNGAYITIESSDKELTDSIMTQLIASELVAEDLSYAQMGETPIANATVADSTNSMASPWIVKFKCANAEDENFSVTFAKKYISVSNVVSVELVQEIGQWINAYFGAIE